jgi:glycosyltransferase involved in cell wall biosynthesis
LHICLLTSARIFDIAYGGDGKFTTSLGNWLINRNLEVTMIGSGFISAKAKHFSKSSGEQFTEPIKEQRIQKIKTFSRAPYIIYALSRLFISASWIFKIISTNLKFPITLIHAQDTGYAGLAAVIAGRILGIPVLISSHGIRHKLIENVIHGRLKGLILRREYELDMFTIKNAHLIMVDNSAIKSYFEQYTSTKVEFIPVPIKLENFQFSHDSRDKMRDELKIDENTKVIGFVGRFSPEKNLHTLLVSFSELVKIDDSLLLVLVGTGPLESELKGYVSKNSINNRVIFTGVRHDISTILSGFDIFVLPSYVEGLSTSLLEAMSCGRSIICSDIPANRELVTHNSEALLVNPHDPNDLKGALKLLYKDDALRLKLGQNAKFRTSQFDESIVFSRILEYYESLSKGDGYL